MHSQSLASDNQKAMVAVVDYGQGNLFSVQQACEHVGLRVNITNNAQEIFSADAVILPGVGAFGDAMDGLEQKDLIGPLQEVAASRTPLLGICLGMQLLMSESEEFGNHKGLGIIEGAVVRFDAAKVGSPVVKVPQVGWNQIQSNSIVSNQEISQNRWNDPLLKGLANNEYMYFVHSYYAKPTNSQVVISTTTYGDVEFCSSLRLDSVFACQFHPERSGPVGLKIYQNLASLLENTRTGMSKPIKDDST